MSFRRASILWALCACALPLVLNAETAPQAVAKLPATPVETVRYSIKGLTCALAADLTTALEAEAGVVKVSTSVKKDRLKVGYDPEKITVARISKIVKAIAPKALRIREKAAPSKIAQPPTAAPSPAISIPAK